MDEEVKMEGIEEGEEGEDYKFQYDPKNHSVILYKQIQVTVIQGDITKVPADIISTFSYLLTFCSERSKFVTLAWRRCCRSDKQLCRTV